MTSIGLTRGGDLVKVGPDSPTVYASANFTIGGDQDDAMNNDEYVEWSISANTAFEIDLDDIDLQMRRSDNGPSNWQMYYSLDGFTSLGSEVDISGPQTITNSNTTFNLLALTGLSSLNINSGPSGTITFRIYAWGALASNGNLRVLGKTDWALSPSPTISQPGIRMVGSIVTPVGASFESDIISSNTFGIPAEENIAYVDSNSPSGLNILNSTFLGEFTIRDGGTTSPDGDSNPTIVSSIEFAITNSENIAALAIYDGFSFSPVAEITDVTALTTFSGLNISAPDNGVKQFLLTATFKSEVTDNDQIQLTISTASTALAGTSFFTDSNASGAATDITGDVNRIEVTVDRFVFEQQPSDGNDLEIIAPFPTVLAVDMNSNLDVDANINSINVSTTTSTSIVPETYDMVNGMVVLDNVIFTDSETNINLEVSSPSIIDGISTSFSINGPLLNIAQQNFDTATDWSYTSDTASTGTVSDWTNGLGYLGEIDLTNASPLDSVLFNDEIFGENDSPGIFWITLTFADIDVSNYVDLSILFDWQVAGYTNNSNDIQYRLVKNGTTGGEAGGWVTLFDGNGDINDAGGRATIDIPSDDWDTAGLLIRFANNLSTGYAGFDNFRLVSKFSGLIYTASDGWKDNIEPDETTGSLDALVVDGTYDVSGDVQIDNLIINNGASTVVGFGESIITNSNLINDGSLELNSISNNFSSLIVNGTVKNEVTYNRHVNQFANTGTTSGSNDLISAPVTNASQTFLALRTVNPDIPSGTIGGVPSFLFGPFDNNTNAYLNYTAADDSSPISSGIGYRTASDTPSGSSFTFVGDVETETKLVPINAGTGSNFSLIGNPYPSYISLSEFLGSNNLEFNPLLSGVYGYDGEASDGFTIWNQAYSEANPNALITPGQGFLVSSQTGGGTITFEPTMRSVGTTDDFILGRTSSQNLAHIILNLTSENSSYNTSLYFNNNASLGMDPGYDSRMLEDIAPDFAIYSHLVENNTGNNMAVQSVSYDDLNDITIPLGINTVQGEQVTISIADINIPEDTEVYLEDNALNIFKNLKLSNYIFTPSTNLTETGRFYVHFSSSQLGITENLLNGLEIYTNSAPKAIIIKGQLEGKTAMQLYDIQGRVVMTSELNSKNTKHSIDVSHLSAGVYVVQLQNATSNRTEKVIIR
jgi:hypothetical protein